VPSLRRGLAAWAGRPFADSLAPGQLNALSFQARVAAEPTASPSPTRAFRSTSCAGRGTLEAADRRSAAAVAGTSPSIGSISTPTWPARVRPAAVVPRRPRRPAPRRGQPADCRAGAAAAARGAGTTRPIEASALRAADLDLNVTLAGSRAPRIELGQHRVRVQLNDGQLDSQISEMALYAASAWRAAARGRAPGAGVPEPDGADRRAGAAAVACAQRRGEARGHHHRDLTLRASGNSQRALVEALDGQARIARTDGALVGVNLAALVRSVGALGRRQQARARTQRTDFKRLSASFAIQNGVRRQRIWR
jgi:hypothetical protein